MIRKLSAAAVSLGLMILLYVSLDVDAVGRALGRADPPLLIVSLLLLLPPLAASAWRLSWMAPPSIRPGRWQAFKLISLACAFNLALPSKFGDLSKAVFLGSGRDRGLRHALALVLFEKGWDLLGLLACGFMAVLLSGPEHLPASAAWVLGGLLALGTGLMGFRRLPGIVLRPVGRLFGRDLSPFDAAWEELLARSYRSRKAIAALVLGSIVIWLMHLLQIWTMARALHIPLPFLEGAAVLTVAVLAGLLPFTLAGIGTRDAALVLLLSPYADSPTAAALGLLFVIRLVLPAMIGVALMPRQLTTLGRLLRHPTRVVAP